MKIVMIGSGNLATQLSLALKDAGREIVQVYSRTEAHAQELTEQLGCDCTTAIEAIRKDADVYVFSVKDDALSGLIAAVCSARPEALFLHTAGSVAMDIFKDPKRRVDLSSGRKADFLCARKLVIPVNRENALRSGIVPEKFADMIPDSITLEISENKSYISKPELFLLDLLSNYQWDRPLHLLNMGGDLNVGIKDYLMYDGFSYRFVPFKNKISATDPGLVDSGELYRKMTEVYSWDALKRTDYFVDYQNYYTFLGVLSQRALYVNVVRALIRDGENEKALEMLDACQENVPEENFPLETIPVGFSSNDYMVIQMVSQYYQLGAVEKARDLAVRLGNELMVSARFFLEFYDVARSDFEYCGQYIYVLTDEMRKYGDKALGDEIEGHFNDLMHAALGDYPEAEEAADSLATE